MSHNLQRKRTIILFILGLSILLLGLSVSPHTAAEVHAGGYGPYSDATAGAVDDTNTPCTSPLQRTVNVPDAFTVDDLDVYINITHTWRGDISVTLESPGSAVSVEIIAPLGSDSAADYDVTLDSDAAGDPHSSTGGDTVAPSNSLDAFDGLNAQGDWTLIMCDDTAGDGGTYNNSSLTFAGTPLAGPGEIDGVVFNDNNGSGSRDANEAGVAGVDVTAVDENGTTANTTTAADGSYAFAAGEGLSGDVRVEFALPTIRAIDDFEPGVAGGTTVQFVNVDSGAPGVDVGLTNPMLYCQDNPDLVTSCFLHGDQPTLSGATDDVLVSFDYDAGCVDANRDGQCDDGTGTAGHDTPAPDHLASGSEIGSTFGLAYQRSSDTVFAASFMKRHSGFRVFGATGEIYSIANASTGSPTITSFVDLDALGFDTGTDPHPADAASDFDWEVDGASYEQIGKLSFGDLDISDDDTTLYTVNLFDRAVYEIPIMTPLTAGDIMTVSIPLPGDCSDPDDVRPFATDYEDGRVYVGMVCSAESTVPASFVGGIVDPASAPGDHSALRGYVYSYDPTIGAASWNEDLNFPLNYTRGCVVNSGGCDPAEWHPWIGLGTSGLGAYSLTNFSNFTNPELVYPQPWLTDIDFDNGNMVIGIRDRFGDQMGYATRTPNGQPYGAIDGGNPDLATGDVAGDILRACGNPTSGWVLESNGTCGSITTPGAGTGQGPDNGEYYYHDDYPAHDETVLGGLVAVPGARDVVVGAYDPIFDANEFFDGGVIWLDNLQGDRSNAYRLFNTSDVITPPGDGTFAKGGGLGDLEAMCFPAPIEIGNRIWDDLDGDGIQDPNEPGIGGLDVVLNCGGSDITVQTASVDDPSTPANEIGSFVFSNAGNAAGELVAGATCTISVDTTQGALSGYSISPPNADADISNDPFSDIRDSDAFLVVDDAVINVSVGNAGDNNHSYDFGFSQNPVATVEDYGDLPDATVAGTPNYPTLEIDGGPSHEIDSSIYLGECVDGELNGSPDDLAGTDALGGDDNSASNSVPPTTEGTCAVADDDEDGITFVTPMIAGEQACIHVSAQTAAAQAGNLSAWFDWDADGSLLTAGDQVLTDVAPNSGTDLGSGIYEHCFTVPATPAHTGTLYSRFRLSTDTGLAPTGSANDGEVEDYALQLACVGNFVWLDEGTTANEQDGSDSALGNVGVNLVWAGQDGVFNTADDATYSTTTDGTTGEYAFCGLIEAADAYQVVIPSTPAGTSGLVTADSGADDVDSDGAVDNGGDDGSNSAESPVFSISLPETTGEGGTNDGNGNPDNYPDDQDDLTIDFGYQPGAVTGTDWGDLPDDDGGAGADSYATNSTDGGGEGVGPSHVISGTLYLGSCVDAESDGQPSAANSADQDDANVGSETGTCATAGDDEDGISFVTPLIPGEQACIEVTALNADAQAANLSAWIGSAGDGTLTQVLSDVAPNSGTDLGGGVYEHCFTMPATSGHDGTLYARFRLSTDSGLAATGAASDGEVEDYALNLACVGNFVWSDIGTTANEQDAGDSPLSGVTVNLVWGGPDGIVGSGGDDVTYSDTTDGSGLYHFCGLPADANDDGSADQYQVTIPSLPGTPVSADQGGDEALDSDGDGSGNGPVFTLPTGNENNDTAVNDTDPNGYADGNTDLTFDFGFEVVPELGAIGNYVWVDENADGFQDAGERGIPGVIVTLELPGGGVITTTTDANGGYLFDNLPSGTYTVTVDTNQPALTDMMHTGINLPGADFGNQDPDGYAVTIGNGNPLENLTADFGFIWGDPDGNTGTGAIGDAIWLDADGDGVQDPDEIGIEGVCVQLVTPGPDNLFGTADDMIAATTTTDSTGYYIFTDLAAGAYQVHVCDSNFDPGGPLENFSQTGDPDHFGGPGTNNDNITTAPIVLAPGDVFLNADFGYQPPAGEYDNAIGDTIWFDADADGVEDAGEYGIPGVTVVLLDSNGDVVATTTTDENGMYLFDNLPDGTYTVWVNDTDNVLGDLVQSGDPDATFDNMSTTTVSGGQTDLDQDFGYTPEGHSNGDGLIGDTIWFDIDGSGGDQGTQGDEPGIEGVVVTLTYPDGTIVTTTTDENGNYWFGGLDPSETYTVTISPVNFNSGGVLEGMSETYDPDGGTAGQSVVDLSASGGTDLDQDFSYTGTTGQLGNLVWLDDNADGDDDSATNSDEAPIAGVTIDLYRDLDCNGQLDAGEPFFASTTTVGTVDATEYGTNGVYDFDNLPIQGTGGEGGSCWVVDVSDDDGILLGYWHSLGTQGADNNSQTDPYGDDGTGVLQLSFGEEVNLTADFGYYVDPAKLGNFVWNDLDGDGVQDGGEPGIDGITMTLTITYPNGSTITLNTVTGDDPSTPATEMGWYGFCNLLLDEDYNSGSGATTPNPGEPAFEISAMLPPGLVSTVIDEPMATDQTDADDPDGVAADPTQGQDDIDQNNDPSNEGDPEASYDFGVTEHMALGNLVFADTGAGGNENNGQLDNDESGIDDVTVMLYLDDGDMSFDSGSDTFISSQDTAGGGLYLFTDLSPGCYFVHIPNTEFQAGGNLYDGGTSMAWQSSSGGGIDDATDHDADENGVDDALAGTSGITSNKVCLTPDSEPTSATDGELQDNHPTGYDDADVNLTADFGFFPAGQTAVIVSNADASSQTNSYLFPMLLVLLVAVSWVAFDPKRNNR